MGNFFSGPVTVFHGFVLPEVAIPTGYVALIDAYRLPAPFPRLKMAIGLKHNVVKSMGWHMLTPRHQPEETLIGHLEFALKYEGIDLCILKKLFEAIDRRTIETIILDTITGSYSRRIWFLYEWLMGTLLDIPDAKKGNYVLAVNPKQQVTIEGKRSKRHRVVNNLLGTPDFCPMIKKTEELEEFLMINLKGKALQVISDIPKDVVARATAFLLLKDSKASFSIENEALSHDRIQRWGNALREAGKSPLSKEELIRLQHIVIGSRGFVKIGFRDDGGFIGEHDRETGTPIVEHISARYEDIDSLISGLIAYNNRVFHQIDPVVAAAAIAFGFVIIHPFSDGNGRIHRYLIHHILVEYGYNPPGMIFPISSAMLLRIEEYASVLNNYSQSILPFIRWEPTEDHNVRVLNSTIDYYRYFDATPYAEFLYHCVQQTIEHDLPKETRFLMNYDRFRETVQDSVEMPDSTVFLLYSFISHNEGKLSKRAREKEFLQLTTEEIEHFEAVYNRLFNADATK